MDYQMTNQAQGSRRKAILITVAIVALIAAALWYTNYRNSLKNNTQQVSASAVENTFTQKSKYPTTQDLVGTWEMVSQQTGPNVTFDNQATLFPFQRFEFTQDGYVKNLAQTTPFDGNADKYMASIPKNVTYHLYDNGLLQIRRSAANQDAIMISLMTDNLDLSTLPGAPADAPKLQKGDITLSYMTAKGEIYLTRQLRKIQ